MEVVLFYIAGGVSVLATLLVVTRTNATHALIYLIVSLLAVAVVFFLLGAPFASALEIVIYAGAIMVLFLFVVMMLNLGRGSVALEKSWLSMNMWIGPGILSAILFIEMMFLLTDGTTNTAGVAVLPKAVGLALYGQYLLAVELASMLLLSALVASYHLGRRYMRARREEI